MDITGNEATGNPDDERALIEQHKSSPFYSDGYFDGLNGVVSKPSVPSYSVGYRAGERARTLFNAHGLKSNGTSSFTVKL